MGQMYQGHLELAYVPFLIHHGNESDCEDRSSPSQSSLPPVGEVFPYRKFKMIIERGVRILSVGTKNANISTVFMAGRV
jgi:hypothetical protein